MTHAPKIKRLMWLGKVRTFRLAPEWWTAKRDAYHWGDVVVEFPEFTGGPFRASTLPQLWVHSEAGRTEQLALNALERSIDKFLRRLGYEVTQ